MNYLHGLVICDAVDALFRGLARSFLVTSFFVAAVFMAKSS
ncbi:MAG TPA: hypothetical protein VFX02_11270 [Gammaproteobacteria bacterium]|nr:hypothetical protein [Gammaproteobacteria bacterium]